MTREQTHRSNIAWVIVGPTAAGKSAVALAVAQQLPGEIVVADSRQIYRGLPVTTSQPTLEEQAQVPHHLVGFLDPRERFSAGEFVRLAQQTIEGIQVRGHTPVVVGGTGLYLRALLRGLAPLPPRDLELRRQLTEEARTHGVIALHQRLAAVDALAAEQIHPHNLPRLIRALEVFQLTGKPLSWWHRTAPERTGTSLPTLRFRVIGLRWDRQQLKVRITSRTRWMLSHGMIQEIQRLLSQEIPREAPAFQGLGIRHVVGYLHRRLSREALEPAIVRDTVQYAKRQMTWFRKEPAIRWVDTRESFDAQTVATRCLELAK